MAAVHEADLGSRDALPAHEIIELVLEHSRAGRPYQVLGLEAPLLWDQPPSDAAVRLAFLGRSRLIHPDKCSHPEATAAFQALSHAYNAVAEGGSIGGAADAADLLSFQFPRPAVFRRATDLYPLMSGTLATVRVLLRDRTLQGQVAGRSSSAAGPMGTSFFAPAAGGMSSAAAAVHAAAEEGFGPGGRFFSAATAAAAAEGPFPGADHPARRQPKLGHGSGSSAEADPPPADRSLLAAMASILLARVLGLLLDLPLVHRVVARPPQLQRPADVTGTAGSNHWSDDVSLSIEGLLRLLIRDRRRLVAARRHTYAANSPHVDLSQPGAVSAFGQERLRVVAAFLMMLSRVDHPLALSEPMLEEDEDALAGGHRPRAAPCDCDFLAASKAHRCSECPAHGPSNRGTSCPSFLRDFVPCSEEQCALFLNLPMADPRSMQHLEAVRLGGLAEGLPGFPVTRGGATADSDDAGEEPGGHFPGLLHGRWRRFIARWPLGIVLLAMRLLPAIGASHSFTYGPHSPLPVGASPSVPGPSNPRGRRWKGKKRRKTATRRL
ncbi:hypothetical protein, variant 1 [Fonticula alba]|uniref:J domain-containing protein n=1 Tax=Fonticula alba TaxID=691883 RepID=A0A058Z6Z3_FONAL|nr:hypothetical protein, variant 1 [Fonticula alba]KCV69302.1 hypothetical protein, variant 1 [Fonticula alba]|eukprot:XP_009495868.1 hypothetical protein, variant 1 [Fonticula alba]